MTQCRHDPPKRPKPEREKSLRPVIVRFHNGRGFEDRQGYFHKWSHYVDENGIANTVGIIEWLDGTCTDRHVGNIKFTDI